MKKIYLTLIFMILLISSGFSYSENFINISYGQVTQIHENVLTVKTNEDTWVFENTHGNIGDTFRIVYITEDFELITWRNMGKIIL